MNVTNIDQITGYHAHIYFDADTEADAQAVRDAIDARFTVTLGRWHRRAVGPHTRWMYQVIFATELFASFVPWLALNRRGLAILVHPESGNALADHTDHAIWMGEVLDIKTDVLKNI
jgi:DOPA 4,5-dioxygenase